MHVVTMVTTYSKHKKNWPPHPFILAMKLMTYLWNMMTILSINIMQHFYHQITINMYLLYKNIIHRNEEFVVIKTILDLLLNKSNSFELQLSLLFFILNEKTLSQHMDQISEHINSSNKFFYSHDQTRKMIVNWGSNIWKNNNNSTCQLSRLHNLSLVSIVDTWKRIYQNFIQK